MDRGIRRAQPGVRVQMEVGRWGSGTAEGRGGGEATTVARVLRESARSETAPLGLGRLCVFLDLCPMEVDHHY